MRIAIRGIEYYLPEQVVSNEQLAAEFPGWSVQKIQGKTGIVQRHIAAPHECASDLGFRAAELLFATGVCSPDTVDYLLFCTQSPDYLLPTTACLLQDRLGIPKTAGALDFNLGCSGYIYGLGLAQGLIATGQARRVLLITAETYSRFIHPQDKSVRTLFGDAAAATLLEATPDEPDAAACYVYGTDGAGGSNLMVPAGGTRMPATAATGEAVCDASGNWRSQNNLFMDGAEIFNFTLQAIPESVHRLLEKAGRRLDEIDLFVFHQANQYMLEHLRRKLQLPAEKFEICLDHCGNTVSSTIPIALRHAVASGKLQDGQLVMLVGFGVGYSWGATLLRWPYLGPEITGTRRTPAL
jgi:3-oxoacyl-[acyl-carrier-protein] synthase-3